MGRYETRVLTPREMDVRAATLAQKVSQAAFDLIVQHETGGRKYYEKVQRSRGRPWLPNGERARSRL
jgi:hypothetical protein